MALIWKILKIAMIVLLCLVFLAVIGGYIFLKTFDIKKYKGRITTIAGETLGRAVTFDNIDLQVSLKEGVRFKLDNLAIAEDPSFGEGDFARVKHLSLNLDVLSFLNARQVSVPGIVIDSPEVSIIRDATGSLNIQSIGQNKKPTESQSAGAPTNGVSALPAVFVNALRINDARINFVDRSLEPVFEASVAQLNVKVDRFSLTHPFSFMLDAAILNSEKNFSIGGNAQLNMMASSVNLTDVVISTDLGQLPLQKLRLLPALSQVPIPEILEGRININIKECALSDKGVGAFLADTQWTSGKIVASKLVPGVALDISHIDLTVKDFSMSRPFDLVLKAAFMSEVPNIDLKGTLQYDIASQSTRFNDLIFSTDLALWPLETIKQDISVLKETPLPQKLAGKFTVDIKNLSLNPGGVSSVLANFQWKEGLVSFKDDVSGMSVDLSKIDLAMERFSLDAPFDISLRAAYLNSEENISLRGAAGFDLKTQKFTLNGMRFAVDLGMISLDQLRTTIPALKDVAMPEVIDGDLELILKEMDVGPAGLSAMVLDANLIKGKIAMPDAAPGIDLNANLIDLSVRDLTLNDPFKVDLKMAYLSEIQNIIFNGNVAYDLSTQQVKMTQSTFAVDLGKLNLQELKSSMEPLKDAVLPDALSGQLDINIKDISASPKGIEELLMDIALTDAAVTMREITPGVSLAASQIGVKIKDFSLDKPFGFHINAAYLNDAPNIDLAGTVEKMDFAQTFFQIKDTVIKTDLASFSLDRLKSSITTLKDVALPQAVKGQFNAVIKDALVDANGLSSLIVDGELTNGSVELKELALPVDIAQAKFQINGTSAAVEPLLISLGKGRVDARLTVDEFLTRQVFKMQATVDGLDMAEVIDQKDASVKIAGKVFGKIQAQGEGANVNSLTGDGSIDVKEMKIIDLNVLKLVLDNIAIIPNLSEKVKRSLPPEYLKKLEDKDTHIKKATASFTIADGKIHADPADIQSDEFMFLGICDAGINQEYKVNGAFMIPRVLADGMIQAVSELQYLRDANDNIQFSLIVKGKGSQIPVFLPDVESLLKNAAINKGKEEFGKVLKKVLKSDEGEDGAGQQPDAAQDSSSGNQKSTEEQIIDSIFGTIFK